MADPNQSFEAAAIQNLYRKLQSNTLDRYSAATDKWTKSYGAGIVDTGTDVTEGMRRQSQLLTDAESVLGDIETRGKYDSHASYAASVEKGIQEKMRAMNMLDQASEEVTYDPMVAEFVDPLTGETVDAKTYDMSSKSARRRKLQSDLWDANTFNSSDWEAMNIAQYGNHKWGDYNRETGQRDTLNTQAEIEQAYTDLFGEGGKRMKAAVDAGKVDFYSVYQNARNIVNEATHAGYDSALANIESEYQTRAQNAIETADAMNTQSSLAAQSPPSLRPRLKPRDAQSIQTDKQNLARQSAGSIGGKRKARIDYGGSGKSAST